MKITLNSQDKAELIKYLEVKEENIAIASMLNELCFSLDQFEELKDIESSTISNRCKELFIDYFELDDNNEDNIKIINTYLSNCFFKCNNDVYDENPFKKSLKVQNIVQNSYKYHYLTYPKYSFFPLDDIKVDEKDYYREYSSIGYFPKDYQYLTLSKNNNIWMCITPNEINTMKPHIAKAHDNVVTFGLGLGYFAFMAANKKEVNKVTVIEKDKEVINLFMNYIYPHIKNNKKIEIICIDAFDYINKNHLNEYNYAFFDLWHNAEDGLPLYIKAKEMNIGCETGYWIEESLIAMYRRCLLTVIEESLEHYVDDDYRKSKNAIEKIINQIYFKTKNVKIFTIKELHSLLSKESIIKLIEK